MEMSEEIKEARDILQNIIKAKKTLRMYPPNNPIYIKTLQDSYDRFREILGYKENLTLIIKQNSIYYESEEIYQNAEKEDNLALFFFKDGLRELTFKKGLLQTELEEFLRIIALDFDREAIDDDVVTLLWEKDFQNIHYLVDDTFLLDVDEEDYETRAEEKLKETVTDVNDLMKAYTDGFVEEEVKDVSIVPLADKDLQMLVIELEKDSSDKIGKLAAIIFEIIYQAEDKADLEDSFAFLKETVKYALKQGDLHVVIDIAGRARSIIADALLTENEKKYMRMLFSYLGNEEIIGLLAEILDGGIEVEGKTLEEFVECLDKNAIRPLVKYLGELKTIRARKSVIDMLVILGKKDIQAISRGLEDQRWYVVRNIIYILRKIGDKRAVENLLKTVRHGDVRVRKEVIKALGELGGREVIQTLRECLDDGDMQVRISASKAFGNLGTEVAKKIMLDKISGKTFREKDFEEKKEFFEVLSMWRDREIFEFLVRTVKRKAFFRRSKNYENKACAAFALGLFGDKDALPILEKLKESSNKLLKDFSCVAIKKLEHGQ